MTHTHILALLLCLCLVAPVTAVTYSEEYYMITEKSNQWFSAFENVNKMSYRAGDILSAYELRRQTILMEKQNELLEEQNLLLRNLTRIETTEKKTFWYRNGTVVME